MSYIATETCTTIYPAVIARAVASIDESPVFRDMPDGFFRIVVRIVKKINLKNLKAPIFASRSTLSDESDKSIETVHRAIRWLEDRSLFEREQKSRRGLRGSSSPLVPTDTLLAALLLTGAPIKEQNSEPKDLKQPISIKKEQSRFTRIDGFAIPTELAWLCEEKKLAASAVCGLMKQAKVFKKRLADVVHVAEKYIENMEGSGIFGYLSIMIRADKDYGHIWKNEQKIEENEAVKTRVVHKRMELAGRTFASQNGQQIVVVDKSGSGHLTIIRNGQEAIGLMDAAFLNAIDEGKLVAAC